MPKGTAVSAPHHALGRTADGTTLLVGEVAKERERQGVFVGMLERRRGKLKDWVNDSIKHPRRDFCAWRQEGIGRYGFEDSKRSGYASLDYAEATHRSLVADFL